MTILAWGLLFWWDMTTKERYKLYLKSPEWKELRQQALDYADGRCQLCNTPNKLNVHHRFYPKELGTEPVNDLTVLCDGCHIGFHRKFNLRNTNGKAKKKLTPKEKRKQKKNPPPKKKREPKYLNDRELKILDEKIERRNQQLKQNRY